VGLTNKRVRYSPIWTGLCLGPGFAPGRTSLTIAIFASYQFCEGRRSRCDKGPPALPTGTYETAIHWFDRIAGSKLPSGQTVTVRAR
jgi:hypothetical protein